VAPPFLPRAIAPPVGDIAVSNIDVSPAVIDLGSAERVPRLVLRDAPVRDVLALLARAAGLNVAFTEGAPTTATPGAAATAAAATAGPTISLDIENEPVQDVFNYVLRLTGLEANRVGRTIFIGQNLPTGARGLVMRTLRLNQIQATLPLTQITNTETSASSLTSGGGQGASTTNSQVGRTSTATQNVPIRGALQILEELGANGGGTTAGQPGQAGAATANTSQLLRGLQVTADSRTNSITLLGPANLIELATSHLAQLDVRRRQVAVNVKIVEVDLANQANLGASFSFGVANNFFSVDQGQFTGGVGSFRPPTGAEARGSLTGQVVAPNPYATATTFIDPNGPGITVNAGEGTQIIQANGTVTTIPRTTTFNSRTVPLDNPFTGGLTEITQGTPDQITFNPDGTASFSRGTVPTATAGLPSLFQFPKDFLLRLQAQVVNGNAKILTDPTLIVQEGSQSQVNLTQQVFSGFTESRVTEGTISTTRVLPGAPIDVGVILNVQVDRVDDNGFVTMSLSPEVSSPGQQILDPSRNNLLIQQLVNRRRLETGNIRLRDGQTLILTGIIQEQDRTVTTKTPILGDLPLIGALFRSTNRQNNRNEVIVLVTPQIMDDSDRSTFGYNYTPGPEARQILQQRGSRN
jgi:type IV pilus assembly protein PilQ